MQSITVILDSNEYIFGFRDNNSDSFSLLTKIKFFKLMIPEIIIQEVSRNLSKDPQAKFYQFIRDHAEVVFELPPEELHFLLDFHPKTFKVISASDFLKEFS